MATLLKMGQCRWNSGNLVMQQAALSLLGLILTIKSMEATMASRSTKTKQKINKIRDYYIKCRQESLLISMVAINLFILTKDRMTFQTLIKC